MRKMCSAESKDLILKELHGAVRMHIAEEQLKWPGSRFMSKCVLGIQFNRQHSVVVIQIAATKTISPGSRQTENCVIDPQIPKNESIVCWGHTGS